MSVNVGRLSEALTLYADGVDVSATDLDEKHHELQSRLARRHHPDHRPGLLAAAAVLLVLAAAAGGMLWARRPDTSVPASPDGVGPLTGLWRYNDLQGGTLFVVDRDGTLTEHTTVTTLPRGAGDQHHRIVDDGERILVLSTTPPDPSGGQGPPCRSQPILARGNGRLTLGPATVNEPGCLNSAGVDATLTRLSPDPAELPPPTEGPLVTVNDPVELDGLWVLQGTSTVFGVDEIGGPAVYLLDADGDLTAGPDAQGNLTIHPDGTIVLASTGCADTTLRRAQVQGRGVGQVLTAIADTDPCHRFPSHPTPTWIRVF
jgi:hypothetical protein